MQTGGFYVLAMNVERAAPADPRVDELSKADLQAGRTHHDYARTLFEASFL